MVTGPERSTSFETQRPSFVQGEILRAYYDGETDDLLTGGLAEAASPRLRSRISSVSPIRLGRPPRSFAAAPSGIVTSV